LSLTLTPTRTLALNADADADPDAVYPGDSVGMRGTASGLEVGRVAP